MIHPNGSSGIGISSSIHFIRWGSPLPLCNEWNALGSLGTCNRIHGDKLHQGQDCSWHWTKRIPRCDGVMCPCLFVFWNVPLACFLAVYQTNLWSCHTVSCQQRMPRDMNRQRPTQSIDTGERLSMQENWRANSHSINDDIIPVLELIVHWNALPTQIGTNTTRIMTVFSRGCL